ncbi:MAG: hypothetical protein U0N22_07855, partial [Acutalibacter sp.]
MVYLLGGIMVPMSVYHFVEAVRMFENDYLHRLGKRDETHFAVAFHDFYHAPDTKKLLGQHRTIAEASAVESPIRQEIIGFPAHFFARA